MQLRLPLKSPLLRKLTDSEILETFRDFEDSRDFRTLKELIDSYVDEQLQRLVSKKHLEPAELKEITEEIRIFQGISDLPRIVRQICVKQD